MDDLTQNFKRSPSPKRSHGTFFKLATTTGVLLSLGALFYIWTTFGGTMVGLVFIGDKASLNDNLVLHYTFDNSHVGDDLLDASGSGHAGYLFGTFANATTSALVSGQVEQAFTLNGTDDRIRVANSSDFYPGAAQEDRSWFIWVKTTDSDGTLMHMTVNDGSGSCPAIRIFITSGKLRTFLCEGNDFVDNTTTESINDGEWHLVGFTYIGGSTDTMRAYIDGVDVGGETDTAVGTVNPGSHLGIGATNGTVGGDYVDGEIDDVRIYNRALTAQEVADLYADRPITTSNKTLGTTETNPDLTSQLVAHYTFDGPDVSGSTLTDRSGEGNNGTITGAVANAGIIGQAYEFDGSDDIVQISAGDGSDFDHAGSNFSYATWFRADACSGSCYLFSAKNSGADETTDHVAIRANSGGNMTFTFRVGGGSNFVAVSGGDWTDNEWHHVAGVRTGARTGEIYIDGVLVAQDTDNSGSSGAMDILSDFYIGQWANNSDRFDGAIDDLRVYHNRRLTADEVSRLYNLGATSYVGKTLGTKETNPDLSSGLVGHWTFDGPDLLNNAADKSGQGNTGYLTNFTSTTTTRGKLGQALEFDGSDDYVQLADNALMLTEDISFGGWAKLNIDAAASNSTAIISWDSGSIEPYNFLYDNAGTETINCNVDDTAAVWITTVPHTWTHLFCTFDSSTGVVTLYVDGVVRATSDAGTDEISYSGFGSQTLLIGSDPEFSEFMGAIDDIRVYNRTLSADEISRLYKLGR